MGGGHATTTALAAFLLLLAGSASAAPCGDDVRGARVPCRCGDTVVSDTRLRPDDPVVASRCPVDGLSVRASALAEYITLDLDGLAIEGSSTGVGLRIEYGGTDGARIVGGPAGTRGTIRRFGIGVATASGDALASISRIVVRDNRGEGMRLVIAGTLIDDVVATANGGDGVDLRGTGGRLLGVVSTDNGAHGLRLVTSGVVVDAVTEGNGASGIVASGARNDLSRASALRNAEHGIVVRGESVLPAGGRSLGNAADAVRLNGARIEP